MPLPIDPHPDLVPFAPVARRQLTVFGAPVELVLVPSRKARPGRATADRPAFMKSPAARILREETSWRGDGLALTPNKHPFAAGHRLVWQENVTRELGRVCWREVATWVAATGGSAMVNSIGAAATIARAHAHLVAEQLPFLLQLRERRCHLDLVDAAPLAALPPLPPDVELWTKDVPFCVLGVRGPAAGLAEVLERLAEARLTAAGNVVLLGDTAWLYPRAIETPAPWFPYALGAAELWGRWCFVDEVPFAAATGDALERALVVAGMPPLASA
jgi:hypothetical protein